ncbi:MAG TPA: hypothetical protein PK573_09340 [Spirochaetota bacterium]|nr:hypothetical protein [Spirochaetota bacterium]HRZ28646.1 hypothetical protein [Spirochaetota bacterium]
MFLSALLYSIRAHIAAIAARRAAGVIIPRDEPTGNYRYLRMRPACKAFF